MIILGSASVWSGVYNVAATASRFDVTTWVFGIVRDQSIERRSQDITAPDLDDPKLVEAGLPESPGVHAHDGGHPNQ